MRVDENFDELRRATAYIRSISGGKDSTATWLQTRHLNATNVFCDTGNEHPITYDYIDTLEQLLGEPVQRISADFSGAIAKKRKFIAAKWSEHGVSDAHVTQALELLHPTGNPFLDLCLWKGRFPSSRRRFCTSELKIIPMIEQVVDPLLEAGKRVINIQGIRREEASGNRNNSRFNAPMIELLSKGGYIEGADYWAYRPIAHWTADRVFAEHKRHGIPSNPLYKLGASRVGCSPCIMSRKSEIAEWGIRFPTEVARIEDWERLVSDVSKHGASSFFAVDKTPGPHKNDHSLPVPRIHAVVQWASETHRGGQNLDWIKTMESQNLPACSSEYGLCE